MMMMMMHSCWADRAQLNDVGALYVDVMVGRPIGEFEVRYVGEKMIHILDGDCR